MPIMRKSDLAYLFNFPSRLQEWHSLRVYLHVLTYEIRNRLGSHKYWAAFPQSERYGSAMLGKLHQVANGENAEESGRSYKNDEHYT